MDTCTGSALNLFDTDVYSKLLILSLRTVPNPAMQQVSRFVWKLARRHSWGDPVPKEQLIRLVARSEDYDELERVLETDVVTLPFVVSSPRGLYIPNGRDAHIAAGNWLREHTDLSDVVIKATLSRLPAD